MPENHALFLDKRFVLKSPAPWKIGGEAILVIFKFKNTWVEEKGNLPKHLKDKFKGGLGCIILGNYTSTPVGPYRELLFIPGKFQKTKKQAITLAYSSTEASTQNGRSNWGIPTEIVQIHWDEEKKSDSVRISKSGKPVFSAEFESLPITFPVSTALFPLRICQTWNHLKYFTRLTGFGWAKLAKIKKLELNPALFPDIRGISPVMAIKIAPFQMRLPESTFRDDFI